MTDRSWWTTSYKQTSHTTCHSGGEGADGGGSEQFEVFFKATEQYLQEEVGTAVQERRHSNMLYLAKAISFQDLHKRVCEMVPEGTAIPSKQWLRYQFQATHPNAKTAKYFKGRMNIKSMVKKRQVSVLLSKFKPN